jgi:hypothetical protein
MVGVMPWHERPSWQFGVSSMNETVIKEPQTIAEPQSAPEPQLPAMLPCGPPTVQQERKPRVPVQRAEHYPPRIAKAIIAITREMEGIAKAGVHEFHKYRYQRWEDINEKLSPLLAEHGLLIMQSEQSRSLLEQNDKGSVLAIVYHFTIVHESGDMAPSVEWTAIQRLRDQKGVTDDRAASKCHTQAEKMFSLKQFKIRVAEEGREDQSHTLPKKDANDIYRKLQADIDGARSEVELQAFDNPENVKRKRTLPPDWQNHITTRFREKMAELKGEPKVIWSEDGEYDPNTGELIESSADIPSNADDTAPAETSPPTPAAGAVPLSLGAMAREAAMRGKDVFTAFYKNRTREEQAELRLIKPELEALYPTQMINPLGSG